MMVKLVSNASKWYAMLSNQLLLGDAALVAAWAELPQDFKSVITSHPSVMYVAGLVWLGLKFFARLVDQGVKTAAPTPPAP